MQYPEKLWFSENYLVRLFTLLEALGGGDEIDKIKAAIEAGDDPLEDLQVEYTRLFINGAPHVVAPPYASVYMDKTINGKFSEKILEFYQAHGYTMTSHGDLPDNLVHQLEFLSFLAEDQNREVEKKFIKHFFLPWFQIFSARVKEEAEHPFYHVIISIIDFFTKEEEEYGVQLNEA